jgi:hypothetical protein
MITIEQWMHAVNFRISEGSTYGWQCFGSNAYVLTSWDGEHDGVSADITFDTQTQTVFQVCVHDYSKDRAYRLTNPDYMDSYQSEVKTRSSSLDSELEDPAWDDIKYIDLDLDNDMLEKLTAIMNYHDYDERVSISVEFTEQELLKYMTMAHERDITFNEFVMEALTDLIKQYESDPDSYKLKAKIQAEKYDTNS